MALLRQQHGTFLVRADPPGLTDPVAICIIGIGKAGGLFAIVELFRDQLVTLIILISVPLHNRSADSHIHGLSQLCGYRQYLQA